MRGEHDENDDQARRVFLRFNRARNPPGRPCRGRHRPVFVFMQAGKQPVFCVEKGTLRREQKGVSQGKQY